MNPVTRLRLLAGKLRDSFWFIPAVIVLLSMASAAALVEVDTFQAAELAKLSPRLFGASADGSRAMLSAIATSMITVAGVVFSITVVILSQASTQYSPRVLRNFMRDRPTQAVLGVFVGAFAYCLVVLRTIRAEGDSAFIPSLAVLGGMAYAFAGIAMLIFFIHHVAQSIQAAAIVERIAQETAATIDHLFPEELARPAAGSPRAWTLPAEWRAVRARRTGYVVNIDGAGLLHESAATERVIRIVPGIGDFVAEGDVLLEVSGGEEPRNGAADKLRACVVLERQRTPAQDAAFGLQQLVDVGVKALSPGINDPSTAALCIDRLGDLLGRVAGRRLPEEYRMQDEKLRVIATVPDFRDLLGLVVRPLLAHARGDAQVLERLVRALETAARRADAPDRRDALHGAALELLAELRKVRPRAGATEPLSRLRALVADMQASGTRRRCAPGASP